MLLIMQTFNDKSRTLKQLEQKFANHNQGNFLLSCYMPTLSGLRADDSALLKSLLHEKLKTLADFKKNKLVEELK